jgi:hypothetical protein
MDFDITTARHEAAHFVTAWAVDCPAYYVDITSSVRKECRTDSTMETVGANFGLYGSGDGPFEEAILTLAGPVADHWGQDNNQIWELCKDRIRNAIESLECQYDDEGDWYEVFHCLLLQGIDVTDPAQARKALLMFLDAAKEILTLCQTQWQEVTEYLMSHGRIGFDGEHRDQGEEAETFFFRWGENWGESPKPIRDCVAKYRNAVKVLQED